MSGSPVLLHTVTATTEVQAQFSSSYTTYRNAVLTFTNPSDSQGIYRVVTGSQAYTDINVRSLETTVQGKETATIVAVGLSQDESYNFYLQRKEFGSWVKQGEKSILTTKKLDDVNVSTSSRAAVLTWDKTRDFTYTVHIYDKADSGTEVDRITVESDGTQKYTAVFSGLSNTKTYIASIRLVEKYITSDGILSNIRRTLKNIEFTPSAFANLDVDSVFASYVELSWDDGDVGEDEEDGEADFRIVRRELPATTWGVAMDWTPDTTKTFTDIGLTPGSQYQYQLHRRGVDGSVSYQGGSQTTVTTKTVEAAASATKSTVLLFLWEEIYDGASYKYGFTPSGGETVITSVSGLTAQKNGLSPDSEYTFELFVVEKGENVSLSSVTEKTHKSGIITLNQARHTTVSLDVQNFSPEEATYYVASDDSSIRTSRFNLTGDVTHTVEIRGFVANSTNKLYLFRAEHGKWVSQSQGAGLLDHLSVTTKSLTASTSVASTSAMLQWDQGYSNASYEISLYDVAPESDTVPFQAKANGDITNTGGKRSAVITGLSMETEYWGTITVAETNTSGVVEKMLIHSFNFGTSAGAVFQVGEVKASSADLSWDAGEVGEEDGVADFLVRKQEVSVGTWTDATTWLPHTTSSFATISGLKAGTAYKFELLRQRLDGGRASQAIIDVETKTSVLTVSGTASSHIQAGWTEIYPNAQYLLMYKATDGSPVTFGGGPTTGTTALLTDLESSTEYTIELYVLEDGQAVGLQTQSLGSSVTATTGTSKVVIAGGITVAAVVVGVVVYKMKVAAAAKAALL